MRGHFMEQYLVSLSIKQRCNPTFKEHELCPAEPGWWEETWSTSQPVSKAEGL